MIRRKTKSHGKEYVYFICGANKQNKEICSPHRITEQAVYDTVLAVIQSQVSLALDLGERAGLRERKEEYRKEDSQTNEKG